MRSAAWPTITAEHLAVVREPIRWVLTPGRREPPQSVVPIIQRAALGPADETWLPPSWLFPHQVDAARRVAGALAAFRGALLSDAVGLGKTYVALAVASRAARPVALIPAVLANQWVRTAGALRVPLMVATHEAASRRARIPEGDLLIVDEAHRFRNPATRRYDMLARRAPRSALLLVTATPVVNRGEDLASLLRLFLPDHGLALFGVPSIELALASHNDDAIVRATAPLVVARSVRSAGPLTARVPRAADSRVLAPGPAEDEVLGRIVSCIDSLTFPAFQGPRAADLLRLHFLHRLASSLAACSETARRHRTYVERAIDHASRGEALTRSHARRLFGPDDDLQLGLGLLAGAGTPLDLSELDAERDRVQVLQEEIDSGIRQSRDPKSALLVRILRKRAQRKTLVFTTAVATAAGLARALGWRALALASGEGARVASGPIPMDLALDLFAPHARRAPEPSLATPVNLLIATDLVSEGLDLQDADTVVHFDLPWTPLRLEQRLGRIARLGSPHRDVDVFWFVPPRLLECRLRLAERIGVKLGRQFGLGVPTSSGVGRSRMSGGTREWREAEHVPLTRSLPSIPCYSTVAGRAAAAFAVCWLVGDRRVPQVIVMEGSPLAEVGEPGRAAAVVAALAGGSATDAPPELEGLWRVVRDRLAAAQTMPVNSRGRRLARQILARAGDAGRRRDTGLLEALDAALDRLNRGLAEGPERGLEEALTRTSLLSNLRRWLSASPLPGAPVLNVTLQAAMLAIGSEPPPHLSARPSL